MFKYTISALFAASCLVAGTAIAQGKSDQARPAKTQADQASPVGQDNRATQADTRSDNRLSDNASDQGNERRKVKKFEKLPAADAEPLDPIDAEDPCPRPEDCI